MENCRFCLESDSVDQLIAPCKCTGSQKYVHQKCVTKWQEVRLVNALENPEVYEVSDIRTCNVCKSEYEIKSDHRYRRLADVVSPVQFTQKYSFSIEVFLAFLIALFCVLMIPLVLNTVAVAVVLFCYCKGVRFRIVDNDAGLDLVFIRVGDLVQGIRPGILLQATDFIDSGIFVGSLILITSYSPGQGAIGLIINKRINSVLADYIGGPISQKNRYMIHDCGEVRGCLKVTDGVYFGGSVGSLTEENKNLLFLGYCGWAPRQLDGEIRAGYWAIKGVVKKEDLFFK